jgi:hypothetical protein
MFCALLTDVAIAALLSKRNRIAVIVVLLIARLEIGRDGQVDAEKWSMAFLLLLHAALKQDSFDGPDKSSNNQIVAVLLVQKLKRMFRATHQNRAAL